MVKYFVSLAEINIDNPAAIRLTLEEKSGEEFAFDVDKNAVPDIIGALCMLPALAPSRTGHQEHIQFLVQAGLVGTAIHQPSGQEHPVLVLQLEAGGIVHLVIPQLLLDALCTQAGTSKISQESPAGPSH